MSDVESAAERIIDCINREVSALSATERAMVMLYVNEMCKCAVELAIYDEFEQRRESD